MHRAHEHHLAEGRGDLTKLREKGEEATADSTKTTIDAVEDSLAHLLQPDDGGNGGPKGRPQQTGVKMSRARRVDLNKLACVRAESDSAPLDAQAKKWAQLRLVAGSSRLGWLTSQHKHILIHRAGEVTWRTAHSDIKRRGGITSGGHEQLQRQVERRHDRLVGGAEQRRGSRRAGMGRNVSVRWPGGRPWAESWRRGGLGW